MPAPATPDTSPPSPTTSPATPRMPTPALPSVARLWRAALWRAATCPISCPITNANWASFSRYWRRPRFMAVWPGIAHAFGSDALSSVKSTGRFERWDTVWSLPTIPAR